MSFFQGTVPKATPHWSLLLRDHIFTVLERKCWKRLTKSAHARGCFLSLMPMLAIQDDKKMHPTRVMQVTGSHTRIYSTIVHNKISSGNPTLQSNVVISYSLNLNWLKGPVRDVYISMGKNGLNSNFCHCTLLNLHSVHEKNTCALVLLNYNTRKKIWARKPHPPVCSF